MLHFHCLVRIIGFFVSGHRGVRSIRVAVLVSVNEQLLERHQLAVGLQDLQRHLEGYLYVTRDQALTGLRSRRVQLGLGDNAGRGGTAWIGLAIGDTHQLTCHHVIRVRRQVVVLHGIGQGNRSGLRYGLLVLTLGVFQGGSDGRFLGNNHSLRLVSGLFVLCHGVLACLRCHRGTVTGHSHLVGFPQLLVSNHRDLAVICGQQSLQFVRLDCELHLSGAVRLLRGELSGHHSRIGIGNGLSVLALLQGTLNDRLAAGLQAGVLHRIDEAQVGLSVPSHQRRCSSSLTFAVSRQRGANIRIVLRLYSLVVILRILVVSHLNLRTGLFRIIAGQGLVSHVLVSRLQLEATQVNRHCRHACGFFRSEFRSSDCNRLGLHRSVSQVDLHQLGRQRVLNLRRQPFVQHLIGQLRGVGSYHRNRLTQLTRAILGQDGPNLRADTRANGLRHIAQILVSTGRLVGLAVLAGLRDGHAILHSDLIGHPQLLEHHQLITFSLQRPSGNLELHLHLRGFALGGEHLRGTLDTGRFASLLVHQFAGHDVLLTLIQTSQFNTVNDGAVLIQHYQLALASNRCRSLHTRQSHGLVVIVDVVVNQVVLCLSVFFHGFEGHNLLTDPLLLNLEGDLHRAAARSIDLVLGTRTDFHSLGEAGAFTCGLHHQLTGYGVLLLRVEARVVDAVDNGRLSGGGYVYDVVTIGSVDEGSVDGFHRNGLCRVGRVFVFGDDDLVVILAAALGHQAFEGHELHSSLDLVSRHGEGQRGFAVMRTLDGKVL